MREFELLEKVLRKPKNPSVILGPGDDCSAIIYDENHYLVSTSDCLIEDHHFRRNDLSFAELAYKALAVNISDISAMGGKPSWCHLTLAFPKQVTDQNIEEFFESFYGLAEELNIELLGGDLSAAEKIFIDVHISGLVKKENMKTRKGFAEGDILFVTGHLGDSHAGLQLILNDQTKLSSELVQRHKHPPVRSQEALWLGNQSAVRGMMDLSDGLISDLTHLKNCNIDIDLEKLPVSEELKRLCISKDWLPYSLAFAGGEDYELLFSVTENECSKFKNDFQQKFKTQLTQIGRTKTGPGSIQLFLDGQKTDLPGKAFEHF